MLNELKEHRYKSLCDINNLLNSTLEAAESSEADSPPATSTKLFSPVGIVRTALAIVSEEYNKEFYGDDNLHKKYKHLIKGV